MILGVSSQPSTSGVPKKKIKTEKPEEPEKPVDPRDPNGEDNSTDPTIIALIAVEGSGMSIGALLLAVTIVHIVLFNNLSDKFVNIQLQVSGVFDFKQLMNEASSS